MNRIFLTIGLFVAGLMGTGAQAQVELQLGGYYSGAIAFTDLDEDQRNHKFGSDSELYFKGKAKLDNGWVLGFKAEMELEDDGADGGKSDAIDEVFIYVEGDFGKVIFGQEDGIGDLFNVQSPRALQEHTVNDRDMDPLKVTDIQTVNETSGDSLKLIYFTPKFSGFRLGVSYSPDADKNLAGFTDAIEEVGDEIWEIGLLYEGELQDIGVKLASTYITADDTGGLDSKEWNVGVGLNLQDFELSGSYRDSEGDALKGFGNKHDAYKAWDLGLGYSRDAWKYTLQYGGEEGKTALGALAKDGRAVMLAGRYQFAKGFRLGGGLLFEEDEVSGVDGTAFILETALKF
jgi:outer membrane protein OmpU